MSTDTLIMPSLVSLATALFILFQFITGTDKLLSVDSIDIYDQIIVIGDIDSNTLQFIKILQQLQICDQNANWIANKTILIQTGNIISKQWSSSSIQIIDLFIKLQQQAVIFDSLCIGILGNNEMYLLHQQITAKHHTQRSFGPMTSIIRRLNRHKHIIPSAMNTTLSSQHHVGQYLRSLPLARILGKSIFINNINTMLLKHDYHSVEYVNTKIQLYLQREFGDIQLFKKLFYPSSEFQQVSSCSSIDAILHSHDVNRIIQGGEINFEIENSYNCNGKLISVNCGIGTGGFGALQIDIMSDNVYVYTQVNQQYIRMALVNDLLQLVSDGSDSRSFNKFSSVSLGLESRDYLDHVEASLNSPFGHKL